MKETKLIWFRLRFPRDLDGPAVLAALSAFSGVSHHTRLVFDLSATNSGIEHRLAVSPSSTDVVTAGLRATMPSLRLDKIDPPKRAYTRRLLWQLAPATSPIRTDELAAIAASLLSSLFPLGQSESIRLVWTLRPAVRPPLSFTPEHRREGYLPCVVASSVSPSWPPSSAGQLTPPTYLA
jgi:hypothetical protein